MFFPLPVPEQIQRRILTNFNHFITQWKVIVFVLKNKKLFDLFQCFSLRIPFVVPWIPKCKCALIERNNFVCQPSTQRREFSPWIDRIDAMTSNAMRVFFVLLCTLLIIQCPIYPFRLLFPYLKWLEQRRRETTRQTPQNECNCWKKRFDRVKKDKTTMQNRYSNKIKPKSSIAFAITK